MKDSPVPWNVKGRGISMLFDITLHFFSTVSASIRNEVNCMHVSNIVPRFSKWHHCISGLTSYMFAQNV